MSGTGLIGTLTPSQQIQLIYVGYFNRSGDTSGFLYWSNEYTTDLAHGASASAALNQIANEFQPQTETLNLYPFLSIQNPPTNSSQPGWTTWVANVTSLVQDVYANLFDRAADSAGLTYWVNQISTGVVPLGQAILAIANGAIGNDATLLTNKVTAALNFTTATGAAGLGVNAATTTPALIAEAGAVLNLVTTDSSSVTAAATATQAWIASGAGSAQPLTTGVDHITGNNVFVTGILNNQGIIVGNNSTLNPTDTFQPTGTNNTLQVTMLATGSSNNINASTTPVLNNIQTLNITNNSTGFHDVNLSTIAPALTTIGLVNGVSSLTVDHINGSMVKTFNISGAKAGVSNDFFFNSGLTSSSGAPTGTATLNLSGNGAFGVSFDGASANDGIANLTVNSNGSSANHLTHLTDPSLKVLTIAGAEAFAVDSSIDFFASKVDIEAASATGALTLDVSSNHGSVVFNGGSGLDSLTISDLSLLATGTALNGGSGAGNILQVAGLTNTTAEYTAINATKGFDTLGLVDAGGDTVDAGKITVLKHYVVEASAGAADISNLATGSTIDVLHSGFNDSFTALAVPSSTLNLNVGSSSTHSISGSHIAIGNFATVDVTSNSDGLSGAQNTFFFNNAGGENFVLTGSTNTETEVAATATAVKFDASAFTGAFFFGSTSGSMTNVQVGDHVVYGTSGAGDTVLTGSGQSTVVEYSDDSLATPGSDTITFLSGHSVQDAIISEANDNAIAITHGFETVNNFALGTDAVGLAVGGTVDTLSIGTNAGLTLDPALNPVVVNAHGLITSGYLSANEFLTALATSTATAQGEVLVFQDGHNSYVAEATSTTAGHWHVVELAGVTAHTGVTISGALAQVA